VAHHAGFFDTVPGGPNPFPLGPFRFAPKAILFWTTGFAGFNGTASMSWSFGFATVNYANCVCIGSDTIVGHLDCGSVWSVPAQVAPMFAGNSGTPAAYDRQTVAFKRCAAQVGPVVYGARWRTYYLALGGSTLTVQAGALDGSGTQALPFTPQLVFFSEAVTAGAADCIVVAGQSDAALNQGFADMSIIYFCEETAAALAGSVGLVSVTGVAANQFTYIGPGGGSNASYLALADPGGAFYAGQLAWANGSTAAPGFRPQIIVSHAAVMNEDNSGGAEQSAAITGGVAVAAQTPSPAATFATTGAAKNLIGIPGNPFSGWGGSTLWNDSREDAMLMTSKNDGTRTGRAKVSSFDANGFTIDTDVPGGTVSQIQYAALRLSDETGPPCRGGALPILGVG
jgi:hypothetical protein